MKNHKFTKDRFGNRRLIALKDFWCASELIKQGTVGGVVHRTGKVDQSSWADADSIVNPRCEVRNHSLLIMSNVSGKSSIEQSSLRECTLVNFIAQNSTLTSTISGSSTCIGTAAHNARLYDTSIHASNVANITANQSKLNKVVVHAHITMRDALIERTRDLLVVSTAFSSGRNVALYRTKNGWVAHTGCFHGRLSEFENEINETHRDNKLYREHYMCIHALFKAHVRCSAAAKRG